MRLTTIPADSKAGKGVGRWITTVHGQSGTFQEVLNATLQIYPELQPALASAH